MILKQSTAVDVLIGPFVDSTNGYDAETGISPAVKLSKNGQTLAAKNDVTTPLHDADGYYNCELDATDTNTVGTLTLTVIGSATSLPVRHEFQVVEEAVYDAMYAASAAGPLQSTVAARTLDVTATGAAGIDWGNVENPTTAVDLSGTDIQLCDTITTYTGNTPQTADHTAGIADIPTVAEFNARTLASASYFDPAADTVANVTLVATTTTNTDMLTAAAVNAEVDTALSDIHLDHLLAVDYNPASKPGVATALMNELVEDDGGVSRYTINALENAPSGTGASAATIADAVWDEAQADHVGAGTFGITASEIADVLVDTGTTLPATLSTIDGIVDSIVADTGTDGVVIAAAQTVATVTDVTNAVTANVTSISGSSEAADNLEASAETIVIGAAEAGTLSTTQMTSDLTEATDDHYIGRIIIWTSGVLQDQATDITDYAGATGLLTYTAVTEAPTATDTFIIV